MCDSHKGWGNHAAVDGKRETLAFDDANGRPLRGKDEVKTKLGGALPAVDYLRPVRSEAIFATRDNGGYSFVLPDSAADSVNSSADSRPPPAGMPRAMRVSATGLLFKRSTM